MKKLLIFILLLAQLITHAAESPGIAPLDKQLRIRQSIAEIKRNMAICSEFISATGGVILGCMTARKVITWARATKPSGFLATDSPKRLISKFISFVGVKSGDFFKRLLRNSRFCRVGLALCAGVVAGSLFYKIASCTGCFGLYHAAKRNYDPLSKFKTELKKDLQDLKLENPDKPQQSSATVDKRFYERLPDEKKEKVLKLLVDFAVESEDLSLLNLLRGKEKMLCGAKPTTIDKVNHNMQLMNYFFQEEDDCYICFEKLKDKKPVVPKCGHILCNDCLLKIHLEDHPKCPLCRAPLSN